MTPQGGEVALFRQERHGDRWQDGMERRHVLKDPEERLSAVYSTGETPAARSQSKVRHYSVRSAGNTIENVFAKDLLAFIKSKQQGRRA